MKFDPSAAFAPVNVIIGAVPFWQTVAVPITVAVGAGLTVKYIVSAIVHPEFNSRLRITS